jgi:hypothetical protein
MNIAQFIWPPRKDATIVNQHTGTKNEYFFNWLNGLYNVIVGTLGQGIGASAPVTVTLAKLTTGGTNGSLTVTNGVITAYVAPT